MHISLNRNSSQPLYAQLVQDIQRRIRSGALPAGARLPTVRELAQQLGVTRLTIHSAYSELQSGGWVEATVGRGTFVAPQTEPVPRLPEPNRNISPRSILSDMMKMARLPGIRSLAMADAAGDLYPQREFARALEEALLSGGTAALGYTDSQGDPLLRTILAELLRERGFNAGPDEIVVTSGATQGLSLIAQVLARPGDVALVEQPTYLGLLNILNHLGIRAVGVPVDAEGMVVEALEALIEEHRPRFIYTIPVFHNPTGVCLSPARRAALLELIERQHLPLIEDDIYNQLAYEGPPPLALKADDRSGLVLNIGSFSKSMLPGIRIGYIAAAPNMIGNLVIAKQADDLCSPPLLQRALALFIQHGWLTTHLRRALPRYRERRDAMLTAMARFFPPEIGWTTPAGGFSSWVTLPAHASTVDLYLAAIERGVAFTPGDVFFAGPAPQPNMRLAFSSLPADQITEAIQVLGQLLKAQLAHQRFAAPRIGDYMPLV